jgi:flavin-dependent dehydrogenase
MYDVIVVGARCAGSSLAMLLARKGYRVLLLDRATFPSDMRMSTHLIHQPGIARLKRWGLLQRIESSGCPAIAGYKYDFGDFTLTGCPPPYEEVSTAYAPRRIVLDKILVDAAVESGAELREGFSVEALSSNNGLVSGVRGSASGGRKVTEQSRLVVGADGMNSLVARHVQEPQYNEAPRRQMSYFSYWSGVEVDGLEFYSRDYQAAYGWKTNDGLALVGVNWALSRFPKLNGTIEKCFFEALDEAVPDLAARLRARRREERWSGGAIPGYFRKPYGSGWALVGDAGCKMDPCTAAGISNAFRDVELLAEAIDNGFKYGGLDQALADYELRRNEMATPIYEFTCQSALFDPPTSEMKQLLIALRSNQSETNSFFGRLAQTTSVADFFDPANLSRIIAQSN